MSHRHEVLDTERWLSVASPCFQKFPDYTMCGLPSLSQAVQRELQQKEGMLREGTVRKEDFESLVA
jgi:hypothetical protein